MNECDAEVGYKHSRSTSIFPEPIGSVCVIIVAFDTEEQRERASKRM